MYEAAKEAQIIAEDARDMLAAEVGLDTIDPVGEYTDAELAEDIQYASTLANEDFESTGPRCIDDTIELDIAQQRTVEPFYAFKYSDEEGVTFGCRRDDAKRIGLKDVSAIDDWRTSTPTPRTIKGGTSGNDALLRRHSFGDIVYPDAPEPDSGTRWYHIMESHSHPSIGLVFPALSDPRRDPGAYLRIVSIIAEWDKQYWSADSVKPIQYHYILYNQQMV